MTEFQLFIVTDTGPRPLPVPSAARVFADLYTGFELGVYSVWRTFEHNKFLHLEAHLARTRRSMALMGWGFAWDDGMVRRAIHEICTAAPFSEMRVRFDVLAEPARLLGFESRILLALTPFTPYPASLYEDGVKVGYAQGLSRERPLVKTADFAAKRRAFLPNQFHEYLMLDGAERILEGTGSNFYAVRDGAVWTAGEGVLEGVTRQVILDLAAKLRIPVHLEPIHADEIDHLDEAAISSSSRGLLPVVEIAGQVIGNGRPGPISRRILAAYNEYVAAMVKTAI